MKIRGERILVFGDSLSHHGGDNEGEIWDVDQPAGRPSSQPGDLLASMLLDAGAEAVRVDANVGRSAPNFWANTSSHQFHKATDLLASDQAFAPTQVVIILGTNDLGITPQIDAQAFAQLRDAFQSWGAEVWVVGPPVFAEPGATVQAQSVYETLGAVFDTDHIIDARPLSSTNGRAGDGVHFQPDSARAFASNLFDALQSSGGLSWVWAVALGLAVGVGFIWWRRRTPHALGEISDEEWWASLPTKKRRRQFGELESRPPDRWWRTASPTEDRPCYPTKSKVLRAFLDTNHEIVENYGGADYEVSPAEFDAVNHKYNLRAKNAARTISAAVWAAMPEHKPYCLDRIDLDALNDTSPAREAGRGFRLPDQVYEASAATDEERFYRRRDEE